MLRHGLFCLAALSLTACGPTAATRTSGSSEPEISCLTQPGCSFDQSPVRVLDEPVRLPNRAYTFFPVAEPLNFVDAKGNQWVAPARTLTDGASIPKIFTAIVGEPTSPEYVNAAAVHDAYCGVGNEKGPMFHRADWEDVHLMFYDGLIVGGTRPTRAKIMFAAVWLGGPRWPDGGGGGVVSTQGVEIIEPDRYAHPLAAVPQARLEEAMRQSIRHINRNDPNLPELVDYLWWLQREMLKEVAGNQEPDRGEYDGEYGDGVGEEYSYTPEPSEPFDPETDFPDTTPDQTDVTDTPDTTPDSVDVAL